MRKIVFAGVIGLSLVLCADVVTCTVPAGVTNTLDEAFSNGYCAEATKADLLAATDFVVDGAGMLVIATDLNTAGFAGEIHVKRGATLRVTCRGALGDTAHGTFVEDGGTLQSYTDSKTNSTLDFKGEPLTFAGTGATGEGALMAMTTTSQQRNGVWGGTVMTMTGDATVYAAYGYQDFPCNSAGNSLNMNGHTLTFVGGLTATGAKQITPCRAIVTNPGHIIAHNLSFSLNDMANLGGSAANTLTLTGASDVELFGATTQGRKKWTLIDASENNTPIKTSQTGGLWEGPIIFSKARSIAAAGQTNNGIVYTNKTLITGAITNPNLTTIEIGYTKIPTGTVSIASTENVFGGGLRVLNIDFNIAVPGALPLTTPSVGLTNACLSLGTGTGDWTLPGMSYSNFKDATITADKVDFQGTFVKDGTGALAFEATTTFNELRLRQGRLSVSRPCWNAGLWEGVREDFESWSNSNANPANGRDNGGFYSRVCYTNGVTMGMNYLMTDHTFANYFVITYTGYFWNRTGANASVTFQYRGGSDTLINLYVDQTDCGKSYQSTGERTITLAPGAHDIEVRVSSTRKYNKQSTCGEETLRDCGIKYRFGTSGEFLPLVDPGDGSLLSLTKPETSAYTERYAQFMGESRFANVLTAAQGVQLDGGAFNWLVGDVEGPLTVNLDTNRIWDRGSLKVDGTLTCAAADVKAGRCLTVNGPLVFAEGSLVEVTDLATLPFLTPYVAARSSEAFTGCPAASVVAGLRVEVNASNPCELLVTRMPVGTILVFR